MNHPAMPCLSLTDHPVLRMHRRYKEPAKPEDLAASAVTALGGPEYTKRDAAIDLLTYADLTSLDGSTRPSPGMRPSHWRRRLARRLALAIRGIR